jgi:hypothetical protein
MLGTPPAVEALLRVVKDVAAQPGIRRAASEALGLLDPANTRAQEIEATLIDLMEQAALKKESKRETIEALLPLAQGPAGPHPCGLPASFRFGAVPKASRCPWSP